MKTKLQQLNIRDIGHICRLLGTNRKELAGICAGPERYYKQETRLIKGKPRPIATPHGRLRDILDKLKTLLNRIELPEYFYGGVPRKSHITNAAQHTHRPSQLKLDLKDFFPSVSHHRVYQVFAQRLGCTADVARILTQLTTLNGCLPQGSPTSTVLANLAIEDLGKRFKGLADAHNSKYTQFVDDGNLTGPKHLVRLKGLAAKMVRQEGFAVNTKKLQAIGAEGEQVVTGVRVNNQIDIPSAKLAELKRCVEQLVSEIRSGRLPSLKQLRSIEGKLRSAAFLNYGAIKPLQRRLNKAIRTLHSQALVRPESSVRGLRGE
ncbi:MAG TPA: reverse transcriptase family protein [Phycisphaerae bacterium]|nr:reverse transcriptase family protein [Phycisphaerae bacterium]